MRIKKKPALILLMIVSMLCLIFGAVACGGTSAKDAIEKYILPQNETLVDADFTLPKTIGTGIEVKWQSSNTDVIAIEDSGDKYTAKVTLPTEVTTVTLTISSGEHSKNFTVRVDEFSVFTFIKNYKFAQKNTAVKEDFKLETKTTYQGKEATIEWSIDEKYNAWINLNAAKDTVLVTPAEEVKPVEIAAKFTYAGESATQKYSFSVTPILDHRQIVKNMYSQEDYALELSGYIVHVYQALIHEKYGPEATFYMIDDDFCSGYYLYNVEIQEDQVDKYVAGAHVTVTGATGTSYNGLWENKSNSGLAVIDDKDPIDPREKVYAIDTDLLAGAPSLLWHESTFVSLSGWKVLHKGNYNSTSKTYEKPTGADQNLFTLEKNGTEIVVRISKYMNRTDDELAALVAVYDDVNEGEFINVTGILGNYKGFQIQPIVASDITKATAESTNTDGAKVKAAIKAVNDAVAANFSSLIAAHKEVTMPTSAEGVTISYKVAGATNPTVTINGGTFTIDPVDSEKNYDIEVTYKIGDYAAYDFFKLRNLKASAAQLLDLAKKSVEEIELSEVKVAGTVKIPEVDLYGAEIVWAVKDAPTWITVSGNTLTISALPAEATTLTLTATLTIGSETETAEISLSVAAASALTFKAIEAPAAGDYIFALYQGSLEKWLYANGEISTNSSGDFGATTENPDEAATFTLAASGEGWTIKLKSSGKFLELNDNHRWCYVDASTQPWMWNTEAKVLTFTVSGTVYYLGTYSNYQTISASTIDRITGENLNASGQYVAHFGTMAAIVPGTEDAPYTVAEVLDLAKDLADGSFYQVNGEDAYIYIKGYVTDAGKIYTNKQGVSVVSSVYIADEAGGTTTLLLYTIGYGDALGEAPATAPTASPLSVGDYIVIHGCVKRYGDKIEVDKTSTITPTLTTWTKAGTTQPEPEEPTLPEGGTQDDPYTIAEALTVAKALDKGAYTATKVYITGYVVDAGSWSDDYSNWSSIYLADSAAAKKADGIQLYRLNPDDIYLKLANDLAVGATITVYGYLQNYNGTLEITNNTTVDKQDKVTVISYTDPRTVDQKIKAAINAVTLIAKVAGDIDLPKSTVTGVTLAFTSDNTAITVGTDKLTVTRGTADVSVKITVSANAEGGTAQTKDLTVIVRNSSVLLASLSFAKKSDGRESQTDDAQVWKKNGITFTNEKSSSTNKVGDYENPVRVYAKSTVKVEYTSAVQEIVFHCNSTSYASDLQKSLNGVEGVTVTVSGSDVYVVFATAQTSLEFTASAQLRFNSIEVVYSTPAATANA